MEKAVFTVVAFLQRERERERGREGGREKREKRKEREIKREEREKTDRQTEKRKLRNHVMSLVRTERLIKQSINLSLTE